MTAPAPEIRADRSSLRRVVDALADRVRIDRGDQVYAFCPVPEHEDRRQPSLSVTWKDSPRGGKTLLKCHRGCDPRDVTAALNLAVSELFDTPPARPDGKATARLSSRPRRPLPPKAPDQAHATGSAGSSSSPVQQRGELVATHTYTDAEGVRVFDVLRFAGGVQKFGCRSYDRSGRRVVRKAAPAPERRVLYNLPAVLRAVAAGELVYVVEGEKDADAMTAAGVTATTNPFGSADSPDPKAAAGKWLPQFTEALRGAHVVIVTDKDTPDNGARARGLGAGYRHGLYVAGQLVNVAASVELAQARAGKDAHDHLSAGLPVDDLEPLALGDVRRLVDELTELAHGITPSSASATSSTAPAGVPASPAGEPGEARVYPFPATELPTDDDDDAGRGGGGNGGGGIGGGDGEDHAPVRVIVRDEFELTPKGVFKVKRQTDQATGQQTIIMTPVLSGPVRVTGRYAEDLGDDAPREMTHVDLLGERGDETHVLEGVELKRWESCSWVNDFPWSLEANDHAGGRAVLKKALWRVSGDVPLTPMYGALGWQQIDGRWRYVHAGGVLDGSGVVDGLRVNPPDLLTRFALPAPPRDASELQQAVLASVALLDVAPARITAPLLGAAYRAVLGFSRVTVMPVGTKSTHKTGLSAATVQHYVPTARHDNMPGAGAGEDAGTGAGLEELRYRAGDMLLPLDDLAPDRGTDRASSRLAAIARSQYNRDGKVRMRRDGGLRPTHPPRSLPLVTGEESTTVESAESRLVLLRIHRGDVNVSELAQLDRDRGPELRASLTAAMVQHYADRMPLDEWMTDTREQLTEALLDPELAAGDSGLDQRFASSVADLAVGWRAMLDMAVELGALSADVAAGLWSTAWEGLAECKRRLLDGSARRTAADRVRELLAALLVRQAVSLESREGGSPAMHQLNRYGWDVDNRDGSPRMLGERIGWTDGIKVWLHPGAVLPQLDRQARAESDPLTYTIRGLGEALADAGVIATEQERQIRRHQVQRRVGGGKPRVWEFDHAWLFPDTGDQLDSSGDDNPPDIDPTGGGSSSEDDQPGPPAGPAAPAGVPAAPLRPVPDPLPIPAPTAPAATVTAEYPTADLEPAPSGPERPVEATNPPDAASDSGPGAAGRSQRRSAPGTANSPVTVSGASTTPAGVHRTYLSEWLADQHPEATRDDLDRAELLWHQLVRGIEFRGPFETAKRILNGGLRHQSIPDLPPLDRAHLAPIDPASADVWGGRTWMVPGDPLPEGQWLASYDVNGMYLSAAGCELGTGDPVLTEGRKLPADWAKMPGWVRLTKPADKAPYGLADRLSAGMWVPTPLASYLADLKALPPLDAGLLWPQHRRWLGPLVKLFREARDELVGDDLATRMTMRAIKATYTRLFGGALRSERWNDTATLRPDWGELIRVTGQARMLRNLDKTTARVIGVHVDAAWLVLPDQTSAPSGLKISAQLGKFKPHGRTEITPALIEAHRVGRWRPLYDAFERSEEAR